MRLPDFALERYFAQWEFAVRHVLCASDLEPFTLNELVALADADGAARWDGLALGYTESAGHPALRHAIASLYETLEPEDVLVTAGAEEAIFLTMHAVLEAGAHAIVVVPAYQSLHEVARTIGADVTAIPLDPRDWSLDVAAIERAVRPTTRMIVINFPHSPTGAHIDRPTFDRLVALAEGHGIVLFSDEVYRGLEIDDAERLPAAADRSATAVSLGVMSKTFALAGLRIGWIATRNADLRARVAALKDYTTICASAPSEILALIALRARARVIARSRAIVAANLRSLDAFFAQHAHRLSWVRPRAGSVAFPRLIDERADVDRFCQRLIEEQGVLLLPGTLFGQSGPYFRIGYGRRDQNAALERFAAFLERWP